MKTVSVLLAGVSLSIACLTSHGARAAERHAYNGPYRGDCLGRVAFPMGGIGAGMICLEGNGCLSHVSLRHQPELRHEPKTFAAVCVKGEKNIARVLEGPVPGYKIMQPGNGPWQSSGNGGGDRAFGLPRFRQAEFLARFPFATLKLSDAAMPLSVELTGWSPFTPPEPDDSSLPVAALEYRLTNTSNDAVDAVFSFHTVNFMDLSQAPGEQVRPVPGGFELHQPSTEKDPAAEGSCRVVCDDPATVSDCAWFRGGWFDAPTTVWNSVETGQVVKRGPHAESPASKGASLYVPLKLKPGEAKTLRLLLSWYVPCSRVQADKVPFPEPWQQPCCPNGECAKFYVPWYAARFRSADEVAAYWQKNFDRLRKESEAFRDCLYDTTLPPEVVEAVAANLTILKSPTSLRQADGRFWGWEGCSDATGCCPGTCTHVWNYAQALPHLFPALERTVRETELNVNQNDRGHQTFRAPLPIRPPGHGSHAAADGQLGQIMRVYREWRISGDTAWMKRLWPRVRQGLDFCIAEWDPRRVGLIEEPHHNTYDIEFWGPDGLCSSMYLGALEAAVRMGQSAGDDVGEYKLLAAKSRKAIEKELFDGEYFIQIVRTEGLRTSDPTKVAGIQPQPQYSSPESLALLKKEGPKYQYGKGCLSDGVLGAWIADACGLGTILDRDKLLSHLRAVHRYNFRKDLSAHANPQRPSYAMNDEGGLLVCSWPKGGQLTLPFPYSNEVWTGIEYQVAAHLMSLGEGPLGLEIVRACRDRYDGRVRNPFNEYECGSWYARAMSSFGMLQGLGGARYDAVEKVLYLTPQVTGDFRAPLFTATGFATVGVRDGNPFVENRSGKVEVKRIEFRREEK